MDEDEREIQIHWLIREDMVEDISEAFEERGGRVTGELEQVDLSEKDVYPDSAAFTPLMVMAVAISVGALISLLSDVVLAHKFPGGSVIDARTDEVEHWTDPTLERGTLLILTPDGPRLFPPPQRKTGLDILAEVLTGGVVDG